MPPRIPLGWYGHKPRVIRRKWTRTLATISPDYTARGWLWTIDRVSGALRDEHAHGRCRLRREAIQFAETVGAAYDRIFCEENERRIMRGAGCG